MARAELLKRLFKRVSGHDYEGFERVAEKIIEEERDKKHTILARELEEILERNGRNRQHLDFQRYPDPPKDEELGTPLVHVREPDRVLQDVILSKKLQNMIENTINEFSHWDVLSSRGLKPDTRLLFFGPPGCGKTVTAEAIAGEIGIPLLYIRFDAVVSSLLGSTSSNLRKIFDYASNESWVIFFDEFDAIGRSRADASEHGEIKRVVNSFLQLLDSFHGRSLVIGATNFAASLDHAIWRRFDSILRFDLPTKAQIQELIKKHLNSLSVPENAVMKIVETSSGGSFAEVERICMNILKRCAIEGRTSVSDVILEDALEEHHYRRELINEEPPEHGESW